MNENIAVRSCLATVATVVLVVFVVQVLVSTMSCEFNFVEYNFSCCNLSLYYLSCRTLIYFRATPTQQAPAAATITVTQLQADEPQPRLQTTNEPMSHCHGGTTHVTVQMATQIASQAAPAF